MLKGITRIKINKMNALLLAGGYGKRLKKVTKHTPKCLLPINGVPLLGFWIKTLLSLRINKILININFTQENCHLELYRFEFISIN